MKWKYILYAYFASTFLFAVKFNYDYFKEEGFVGWLLFGEVIATSRAMIWPYYVFSDSQDERKHDQAAEAVSEKDLAHFQNSILHIQSAFSIQNNLSKEGEAVILSREDDKFNQIIALFEKALTEAKEVNVDALRAIDKDLPANYRYKLIQGLEMHLDGYDSEDSDLINKGALMMNEFGTYYKTLASK